VEKHLEITALDSSVNLENDKRGVAFGNGIMRLNVNAKGLLQSNLQQPL
jgi:hypothetical protein